VRKRQGFDAARVIHDYGLVCEVLTGLAIELDVTPTAQEYQLLNRCIDEASARAIESFAFETRKEDLRERAEHLGSLAHEIRDAVETAALAFELVRKGSVGPASRTAEIVQRSLRTIEELVSQALVESQLVGGFVAKHETVLLRELCAQLVAGLPRERGVTVTIAVDPELRLDADHRLLWSAIGNLLRNAIKFTHSGQVVQLRARAVGEAIVVDVEDHCGGLPDSAAEELFQPFVQKSGDARGVGLGLSIARRAVAAHGGTLVVRSHAGVGCVFTMTLPRRVGEASL
jgi:signal transduction histidine kinase